MRKLKRITVNASRKYAVLLGDGILRSCGELINEVHATCKVMLVSDSTVHSLYGKTASDSLTQSGFSVFEFTFTPGEKSKSPETLFSLWNALGEENFSRSDIIVALGGGISGDIAGFAAATYMRGIEYVQIPTTLLAMVDSSVGGKTAVNLPAGKNLAGSFYAPSLVICPTDTLATLPADIFADGMAEIIKYHFICPESFNACNEGDTNDIIYTCVDIKRNITESDEFDSGERRLLNFGHTAGHAIEKLSDNRISHGKAVAMGMALMAHACFENGFCGENTVSRLTAMLAKANLPTECTYSAEEISSAALSDKKRSGGKLSLVILNDQGKCQIHNIPAKEFADFLEGKNNG